MSDQSGHLTLTRNARRTGATDGTCCGTHAPHGLRYLFSMGHLGNWSERKMALEMERAHRGRPLGVSMLRPFDTMQLGWRAEASCDLCQFSRHFRAPADLRKTHWWYVIEATHCPVHKRNFDSIALYSGDRCFMGSVVRLS